jgi:hypothetical protein
MNSYLVKSPIKTGGKIHQPGSIVELEEEHAKLALARGTVEPHNPPEPTRAIEEPIKASAPSIVPGQRKEKEETAGKGKPDRDGKKK